MSLAETKVPALTYWSDAEMDAAVRQQTLFLIPSGMGGSFYARLSAYDGTRETGEFVIVHAKADDFQGQTVKTDLSDVNRLIGSEPELAEAKRRERSEKIGQQNDAFRNGLRSGELTVPGRFMATQGVGAMGAEFVLKVIAEIAMFDAFTEDNNPYGERDFGALEVDGTRLFFKIDYYDQSLEYGSLDCLDLSKTVRVLTVMLPSEY